LWIWATTYENCPHVDFVVGHGRGHCSVAPLLGTEFIAKNVFYPVFEMRSVR
jgi:hypothetical protein